MVGVAPGHFKYSFANSEAWRPFRSRGVVREGLWGLNPPWNSKIVWLLWNFRPQRELSIPPWKEKLFKPPPLDKFARLMASLHPIPSEVVMQGKLIAVVNMKVSQWPEYFIDFFMWKMDPMSGFDIRLETVYYCSTKEAYTSEITFLAL